MSDINPADLSFQTRSESTGLRGFSTLADAMRHAEGDDSVWKVSFTLSTGERIRLTKSAVSITDESSWVYEPIVLDQE